MVTLVRTVVGGTVVPGGGVITLAIADPSVPADAQTYVDAVETFFTSLAAGSDNGVTFQVQGDPARYAAATGELQEVFSATGSGVIAGAVTGQSIPRASQTLLRWRTADVVAGRIVKGRSFLPGAPSVAQTDSGGVAPAWMSQVTGYATTLIDDLADRLEVWHRPVNGAGGSSHRVTEASVWGEFAVLRSRRD